MKIVHLPFRTEPAELLQSTGLALEYFPAFECKGVDDLPMHGHDFVEINFIIKGRCRHVTRDNLFEDRPGSMGIINYRQEHMILTPYGPVEKINIYLDFHRYSLPMMPPDVQEVLGSILPMHPTLQHKLNRIIHLQFDHPKLITHILRTILTEVRTRSLAYQEVVENYFRLFLIECCRTAMGEGIQRYIPHNIGNYEPIEEIRRYIDRNFTQSLTLELLSKQVSGMNIYYLCRRFKEYTGQTVVEYINHRRIEKALVLLRSGKDKILQVCLKSGFNDMSYFDRKFKEIVGTTPGAYRG